MTTFLSAGLVAAQQPQSQQPGHQVNPDGSITFRYDAPAAAKVELKLDLFAAPLPLQRSPDGEWQLTTPPLPPNIYAYSFLVDSEPRLDPTNADVRPNYVYLDNNVTVPGHPPMPWELNDIPHGRVDTHIYTTKVANNLPANQSAYLVYTPPGSDAHRKSGYPVLYLLHGWSDRETGWVSVGKANLILDSLIDSGKAVPMIVVMPLGYGDLDFVTHGFSAWDDAARVDANVALFSKTLLTEVLPAVERDYNVASDRSHRAIAGLSMGGLESLTIGLNHPRQFSYVGAFSAALFHERFAAHFPGLATHDDTKNPGLNLLWVACGSADSLIQQNNSFTAWARTEGLNVTSVETSGAHTWLTWRENLLRFAPLLFHNEGAAAKAID